MTVSEKTLDDRELYQQKADVEAQIEQREREQRRFALAALRGDKTAQENFDRLEGEIEDLRRQSKIATSAVQGHADEQRERDEKEREREHQEALDTVRNLEAEEQGLWQRKIEHEDVFLRALRETATAAAAAIECGADLDRLHSRIATARMNARLRMLPAPKAWSVTGSALSAHAGYELGPLLETVTTVGLNVVNAYPIGTQETEANS